MPPLAVALVLVAGVLHVTWNVLLKSAGDPLRTAATGIVGAAAFAVPLATVGWLAADRPPVPPEAVGLAAVSGAVEVVFFVLLAAAYRRGDLSVVYPIARGTAPLLAVAIGGLVLGEQLTALGWAGVGLLLAGLLVLQQPWRLVRRRAGDGAARSVRDSAVPFALATGVAIATYSAIDRVGVRIVAPWLYAGLLWAAMAIGLALLVLGLEVRRRRAAGPPAAPVDRRRAVLGGVLTLIAYALVLGAFAIAPLSAVAPLRESTVVLASAWGVLRLREAGGRRAGTVRLAASGLVVVGIALLALAG